MFLSLGNAGLRPEAAHLNYADLQMGDSICASYHGETDFAEVEGRVEAISQEAVTLVDESGESHVLPFEHYKFRRGDTRMKRFVNVEIARRVLKPVFEAGEKPDLETMLDLVMNGHMMFRAMPTERLKDIVTTAWDELAANIAMGEMEQLAPAVASIKESVGSTRIAKELWNAVQSGASLSEVGHRFGNLGEDVLGRVLVKMVNEGYISRTRLPEVGDLPWLQSAVLEALLGS